MSDLCKNCGGCHLPHPCPYALTSCDNCKNRGHMSDFCPHGSRDKSFYYRMLCANCDKWHLPSPCEYPLQECRQCLQRGHLASHCPVSPMLRVPISISTDLRYETPHTEPITAYGQLPITKSVPISQGVISLIRFDAAKTIMELLRAYSPAEILAIFAKAVPSDAVNDNANINDRRHVSLLAFTTENAANPTSVSNAAPTASTAPVTEAVKYQTPQSMSPESIVGRRLYIGNIPYSTTDKELREFFKKFEIENTVLPVNARTERPTGYAFVDLRHASEAERAVSELNGTKILDRTIAVEIARPTQQATGASQARKSGAEEISDHPSSNSNGVESMTNRQYGGTSTPTVNSSMSQHGQTSSSGDQPAQKPITISQLISSFPPNGQQPAPLSAPNSQGPATQNSKKRKSTADEDPEKPKKKRLAPVPRCEECKKKKKRCIHNMPAVVATNTSLDPQLNGSHQAGGSSSVKSNATQSYNHGTTNISALGTAGSGSDAGAETTITQVHPSIETNNGEVQKFDKSNFLQGMEAVAAEGNKPQEVEDAKTA